MNEANEAATTSSDTFARLPSVWLALYAVACLLSFAAPASGRLNWVMELSPAIIGIAVLVFTFRSFPMLSLIHI